MIPDIGHEGLIYFECIKLSQSINDPNTKSHPESSYRDQEPIFISRTSWNLKLEI